jgi:hypothetical protein
LVLLLPLELEYAVLFEAGEGIQTIFVFASQLLIRNHVSDTALKDILLLFDLFHLPKLAEVEGLHLTNAKEAGVTY